MNLWHPTLKTMVILILYIHHVIFVPLTAIHFHRVQCQVWHAHLCTVNCVYFNNGNTHSLHPSRHFCPIDTHTVPSMACTFMHCELCVFQLCDDITIGWWTVYMSIDCILPTFYQLILDCKQIFAKDLCR